MTKNRLLSQRRHPGRDLPINRNVRDPNFLHWSDERTRLASVTIEKSFAFQSGDVLHDGCLARETEVVLDFACAWGDSFFALLGLNEIEHAFLPIGQHVIILAGLRLRRKFK